MEEDEEQEERYEEQTQDVNADPMMLSCFEGEREGGDERGKSENGTGR